MSQLSSIFVAIEIKQKSNGQVFSETPFSFFLPFPNISSYRTLPEKMSMFEDEKCYFLSSIISKADCLVKQMAVVLLPLCVSKQGYLTILLCSS